MQAGFQCSYCGAWNPTDVDESEGRVQSYVEDCQTCCQPNVLAVRFDPDEDEFLIHAERES